MRSIAALMMCTIALAGCSNATAGTNSASPTSSNQSQSASPTSPTTSSSPSASSSKNALATSINQARGVQVSADKSQVECAQGASKVVKAQAQMQAPDLDELFLVAMIGCSVNGTSGPEVPEVFHWRDKAWTSVATIRVNVYTVESLGGFKKISENKLHLAVKATDNKGNSTNATLEVRRDGLSYWAEVLG